LGALPLNARLVTVADAHPAVLAWLGGVAGHRVSALGLDSFGQSGDIQDLYRTYSLDTDAIIDAAARALLDGRAAFS
jgi:pyruvate dehydrogenase E1 component